jgi:hypothetical protein
VLVEWIERQVDRHARLQRAPLFVNPRTGRRWSHWALRDRWIRAAKSVGIEGVRLYEGTKHTMATDAVRRGVSERALQTFLGHSDARSTRRYARMSDEALVSVLRPTPSSPNSVDLSPACRQPELDARKPPELRTNVASPTGLEPVWFVTGMQWNQEVTDPVGVEKPPHERPTPRSAPLPCRPTPRPGSRSPRPDTTPRQEGTRPSISAASPPTSCTQCTQLDS